MKTFDHIANDHLYTITSMINDQALIEKIDHVGAQLAKTYGTIFICGNGGSAADAQHFAAELVVRFRRDRHPSAAIALTVDTSILTACANDYGYERVFERQLHALGKRGDTLIAISTSGTSQNVLRAMTCANEIGMDVIFLTGNAVSTLPLCTVVSVPHNDTARIQEAHELILHAWCEMIEELR